MKATKENGTKEKLQHNKHTHTRTHNEGMNECEWMKNMIKMKYEQEEEEQKHSSRTTSRNEINEETPRDKVK